MSSPFNSSIKPSLPRSISMISQRSAMAPIPEIILEENGRPVTMGRSSASSDYQLSSNLENNRNISRVHVIAAFVPALSSEESNRVEITCVGCNGATVSCMAERRDLRRGQKFITTNPAATIMLDVFQARVMIKWPISMRSPYSSVIAEGSSWDSDASSPALPSPERRPQRSTSPLKRVQHVQSPESPTPRRDLDDSTIPPLDLARPAKAIEVAIEIYEDETAGSGLSPALDKNTDSSKQSPLPEDAQNRSTDSGSSPVEESGDQSSEAEEENDPIIHAFGEAGENLTSRLRAVIAGSPVVPSTADKEDVKERPSTRLAQKKEKTTRVQEHVIGRLAYSRLSSIPLSTIFWELPAVMRRTSESEDETAVTVHELKDMLAAIHCVGEIAREGKDASGQPLESEYYYIPDQDVDRRRAAAVQGLGRPELRACRKTHKVRLQICSLLC